MAKPSAASQIIMRWEIFPKTSIHVLLLKKLFIFDKERAKKLPEYTIFRESCVFRYVLDFFSKLVLAQVAQ